MMKPANVCRSCAVAIVVAGLMLMFSGSPGYTVQPDEILDDPRLESRARALSQRLRCVVCQNQTIDDSNAPLARDLRIIVRERLVAGDGDEQVIQYLVARYGNFVLLRPPLQASTVLLWFGPALLLVIAGIGFGTYVRRRTHLTDSAAKKLSAKDKKRLKTLLGERKPS